MIVIVMPAGWQMVPFKNKVAAILLLSYYSSKNCQVRKVLASSNSQDQWLNMHWKNAWFFYVLYI